MGCTAQVTCCTHPRVLRCGDTATAAGLRPPACSRPSGRHWMPADSIAAAPRPFRGAPRSMLPPPGGDPVSARPPSDCALTASTLPTSAKEYRSGGHADTATARSCPPAHSAAKFHRAIIQDKHLYTSRCQALWCRCCFTCKSLCSCPLREPPQLPPLRLLRPLKPMACGA